MINPSIKLQVINIPAKWEIVLIIMVGNTMVNNRDNGKIIIINNHIKQKNRVEALTLFMWA
jgi:hypothetical protein